MHRPPDRKRESALPEFGDTFTGTLQEVALRRPDALAVVNGESILTYRDLDAHSTMIAREFVAQGIQPQDRVAILAQRGIPALVAILGAMKAGTVYVPLDPANPQRRLERLLDEVQPSMIIGSSRHIDLSSTAKARSAQHWTLDQIEARFQRPTDWKSPGAPSAALPEIEPTATAYCMFTSGSTGEPRGVNIRHESIIAFFRGIAPLMRFNEGARCLNTSPIYFDVSIVDTLMPLALGATVYTVEKLLPPCDLLDRIQQARITHFCPPAPLLTLLCAPGSGFERRRFPSLEYIMTGAEVVSPHVIGSWLAAQPPLRILNAYGPTEATCACLAHEITASNFDPTEPIPIGRPFDGVDAILLEPETGTPASDGSGELAVAGKQLMASYRNHQQETDARMQTVGAQLFYKTGDICDIDHNGRFHFRGRKDNEVKFRGFRINLEEIRKAALADERVGEAVVVLVKPREMNPVLGIAWVLTWTEGRMPKVAGELMDALRLQVPAYMIPHVGMVCDKLPRLPSGKTDTRKVQDLLNLSVAAHRCKFLKLECDKVTPMIDENLTVQRSGTQMAAQFSTIAAHQPGGRG